MLHVATAVQCSKVLLQALARRLIDESDATAKGTRRNIGARLHGNTLWLLTVGAARAFQTPWHKSTR